MPVHVSEIEISFPLPIHCAIERLHVPFIINMSEQLVGAQDPETTAAEWLRSMPINHLVSI
jgi:hypothetical protein